MKKDYLKPEVEEVLFTINDRLMDEEDDVIIPDASLGNEGEFPF